MTKHSIDTRWKLAAPIVGIILNGCTSAPTNPSDIRNADPFVALQANSVYRNANAFTQLLTNPTVGATVCGVSVDEIQSAAPKALIFDHFDSARDIVVMRQNGQTIELNDTAFAKVVMNLTQHIVKYDPLCPVSFLGSQETTKAVNATIGLQPK